MKTKKNIKNINQFVRRVTCTRAITQSERASNANTRNQREKQWRLTGWNNKSSERKKTTTNERTNSVRARSCAMYVWKYGNRRRTTSEFHVWQQQWERLRIIVFKFLRRMCVSMSVGAGVCVCACNAVCLGYATHKQRTHVQASPLRPHPCGLWFNSRSKRTDI